MAAEMRPGYSSHIDSVGYDPDVAELHVRWSKGGASVYEGVPAELASEVLAAPSIGEALHAGVRGRFKHRNIR